MSAPNLTKYFENYERYVENADRKLFVHRTSFQFDTDNFWPRQTVFELSFEKPRKNLQGAEKQFLTRFCPQMIEKRY